MNIGGKKIASGFGWLALINYTNSLLGFLTTLILAKLLVPEDFGLVAIASMTLEILQIFKDMGLSESLIYQKREIEKASNTAFVMIILLNSIIFIIAILISPIAGWFYKNSAITPILILMSSNLIWNAIGAIPSTLIRKDINYKILAIPRIIPMGISSIIGIGMAVLNFGVWSLVAKAMIQSFLGMLLVWRISPLRLSLMYDKFIAKELLNYGKFIIGSSLFLIALYNIDKLFVSKIVGIAALGFYVLALRIANMPVSELSHLIGAIMFPVLSKRNEDIKYFQETFFRTLKYSSMISIPMAFGIAIYGPSLIKYFYGDKWMPMSTPLQILSIYALFRSMSTILSDGFKALGRPNLMLKFVIIRLLSLGTLGVPLLLIFGLNGLCILIAGTYAAVFIIELNIMCKLLSINWLGITKGLILLCMISFLLIMGTFWGIDKIFKLTNIIGLCIGIGLAIIGYILINYFLNRETFEEFKKILTRKPNY